MSGVERVLTVANGQVEIELDVIVHREDDMYWAEVPSHPGLFASGETIDELIAALAEAWVLYSHDDDTRDELEAGSVAATTRSIRILVPA
jgi:predicted RNase H-like HicB family nuclease